MRRIPLTPDELLALVDRVLAGDPDAIATFFSKEVLGGVLWALAHKWSRYLGPPLYEPDDLFLEAAEKLSADQFAALRSWRRDPQCHLVHWVTQVVNNHCKNLLRRRMLEQSIFTALPEGWDPPANGSDPLVEHAIGCIQQLPQQAREVIELFLDGYSHEEIARKLSLTVTAVTVRRHRALKAASDLARRDYPDLFDGEGESR